MDEPIKVSCPCGRVVTIVLQEPMDGKAFFFCACKPAKRPSDND